MIDKTPIDTRYRGEWKNWRDMRRSFTYAEGDALPTPFFPTDAEVLLASCEEEAYEGSCAVFWARGGRVYEQTFSHCSCNSYSDDLGQFEIVKPITVEYLRKQQSDGYGRGGLHAKTPETDAAWTRLIERAAKLERNEGRGQAEADTKPEPRGNALVSPMPLTAGAMIRVGDILMFDPTFAGRVVPLSGATSRAIGVAIEAAPPGGPVLVLMGPGRVTVDEGR